MAEYIDKIRVIPVAVPRSMDEGVKMFEALIEGGLPINEIMFRTDCAKDVLKYGIKTYPNMCIGAGTITCIEDCEFAIDAGAKFIVSPGFSTELASFCHVAGVPYYPGCLTPTEIMEAVKEDVYKVKFFPAVAFGGMSAVRSLSAAFPKVKFYPTGGIDETNMGEYLLSDKVFAVGGTWLFRGNYEENVAAIRRAVKISESVR